jgi:hypothetical protein
MSAMRVMVGFLLAVPILVMPQVARSELGMSEKQLNELYGKGKYASPRAPAEKARRHSLDDGQSVEFGLIDDQVVYAHLDGSKRTLAEVSRVVQGLARPGDASFNRWYVDRRQAALYPPLYKNLVRCLSIPVRVQGGHLQQRDWKLVRRYYDGYGRQLGQQELGRWSTFNAVPHVQFVHRYYPARRGVVRLPMIRADGQAYVTFDLTYDSEQAEATTRQVLIATPDCYWQMVFHQLREAIRRPYTGQFPARGPVHYEQALASVLPCGMLSQVLLERYVECLLAAVDDPRVSAETIRLGAACVDKQLIGRRVARDLRRQPAQSMRRRAEASGLFGWSMATGGLIDLLASRTVDEQTRRVAQRSLLQMAAHFPAVSPPTDPANQALWRKWWRTARRHRR